MFDQDLHDLLEKNPTRDKQELFNEYLNSPPKNATVQESTFAEKIGGFLCNTAKVFVGEKLI